MTFEPLLEAYLFHIEWKKQAIKGSNYGTAVNNYRYLYTITYIVNYVEVYNFPVAGNVWLINNEGDLYHFLVPFNFIC